MVVDLNSFALALGGGILIGLSASILLLTHGRIAGISGQIGAILQYRLAARNDALPFTLGMIIAGVIGALVAPSAFGAAPSGIGPVAVAVAGLLVGFGTKLGSGCTSGHGVCGISRLSARSMVATLTFMATGAITVFVVQHILGVGE